MIIWHNILHSYYHSDCKSVDDKEALWSYEREEGKRQTQERFIGPIRESQEPEGASCSTFLHSQRKHSDFSGFVYDFK